MHEPTGVAITIAVILFGLMVWAYAYFREARMCRQLNECTSMEELEKTFSSFAQNERRADPVTPAYFRKKLSLVKDAIQDSKLLSGALMILNEHTMGLQMEIFRKHPEKHPDSLRESLIERGHLEISGASDIELQDLRILMMNKKSHISWLIEQVKDSEFIDLLRELDEALAAKRGQEQQVETTLRKAETAAA
jgi:hypothetical protein